MFKWYRKGRIKEVEADLVTQQARLAIYEDCMDRGVVKGYVSDYAHCAGRVAYLKYTLEKLKVGMA